MAETQTQNQSMASIGSQKPHAHAGLNRRKNSGKLCNFHGPSSVAPHTTNLIVCLYQRRFFYIHIYVGDCFCVCLSVYVSLWRSMYGLCKCLGLFLQYVLTALSRSYMYTHSMWRYWTWEPSPLLSVHTWSSWASSGMTRKVLQPCLFLDFKMSPKMWSPMYTMSFPLAPSRSHTMSDDPEAAGRGHMLTSKSSGSDSKLALFMLSISVIARQSCVYWDYHWEWVSLYAWTYWYFRRHLFICAFHYL